MINAPVVMIAERGADIVRNTVTARQQQLDLDGS
jgi:hypothetical protein